MKGPQLEKKVDEIYQKGCAKAAIQDYRSAELEKDLNGLGTRTGEQFKETDKKIEDTKKEFLDETKKINDKITGMYRLLLIEALGFIGTIVGALLLLKIK